MRIPFAIITLYWILDTFSTFVTALPESKSHIPSRAFSSRTLASKWQTNGINPFIHATCSERRHTFSFYVSIVGLRSTVDVGGGVENPKLTHSHIKLHAINQKTLLTNLLNG